MNNVIVFDFAASHNKSSFDIILVNTSSVATLNDDSLKLLINLVKPKGKLVFNSSKNNDLEARLVLSGYVNVNFDATKNCKCGNCDSSRSFFKVILRF